MASLHYRVRLAAAIPVCHLFDALYKRRVRPKQAMHRTFMERNVKGSRNGKVEASAQLKRLIDSFYHALGGDAGYSSGIPESPGCIWKSRRSRYRRARFIT